MDKAVVEWEVTVQNTPLLFKITLKNTKQYRAQQTAFRSKGERLERVLYMS